MTDHQEPPQIERFSTSPPQAPTSALEATSPNRQIPAGWYADPYAADQLRWWDGTRWGPLQPQPTPQVLVQTNVAVHSSKSVGAAFALTFFFGPLGLFYASAVGGLIMLGVCLAAFFLSFLLFGIPSLLAWAGCIVWGCTAASAHKSRVSTYTSTTRR